MENLNGYPVSGLVAPYVTTEQEEALRLLEQTDFREAFDEALEQNEELNAGLLLGRPAVAEALQVLHARSTQLDAVNSLWGSALASWKRAGGNPADVPAELDKALEGAQLAHLHAEEDLDALLTAEAVLMCRRALGVLGLKGPGADAAIVKALFGSHSAFRRNVPERVWERKARLMLSRSFPDNPHAASHD